MIGQNISFSSFIGSTALVVPKIRLRLVIIFTSLVVERVAEETCPLKGGRGNMSTLPEAVVPLPLHDPMVILVHEPDGEGEVPEQGGIKFPAT